MYIYEAKNLVVDGNCVNGLLFKSTEEEVGFPKPAVTGDKCGLIYPVEGGGIMGCLCLPNYTVVYAEAGTVAVNEGLKVFAYQGTAEAGGKLIKGVFFKAVSGITKCSGVTDGDIVVYIAEEVDGQPLETPDIGAGKVTVINIAACTDEDELDGGKLASELQTGIEINGNTITGELKYVDEWEGAPADAHWFLAVKFDPADGTSVNSTALDESGIYVYDITEDMQSEVELVVTAEVYEKTYTFAGTFEAAPTVEEG